MRKETIMDHTLARKSVYRLVGSLVMAVIFLVGMATPVSALTIQATRGATITMKKAIAAYEPVNGQATSPSYRYGGRFNEQGYGDTSCVSQCPAASEGPTLS